jgi:ubiquinone/menaquinone biosynthesis C-methylase UbiE
MSAQAIGDVLLRKLMLLRPVYPDITKPRSGPRVYVNPALADEEAAAVYADEMAYPFDRYFGHELDMRGQSVFDLGCYCGGRAVAWAQRYGLSHVAGVDIHPAMTAAGNRFAAEHGVSAEFKPGFGEAIPFNSGSFDAVLTFDVLEHVRDVGRTLNECYRILKPGGRMYVVFPQFLHPLEHHLSNVSATPCLHYFFKNTRLLRVYSDIIRQRGREAEWYARASAQPSAWEKCHTINGTSIEQFDATVMESGLREIERIDPPLFHVGRRVADARSVGIRAARGVCGVLSRVPGVREIFTHRIVRVLLKPA